MTAIIGATSTRALPSEPRRNVHGSRHAEGLRVRRRADRGRCRPCASIRARVEVMKEMGINHCCGAQLTLGEAAAAAGVPLDALLDGAERPRRERRHDARATSPTAAHRRCRRGDRCTSTCAKTSARGQEPFARIMAAVKALGPRTRAGAARRRSSPSRSTTCSASAGFAHWTERRAPDDWSVWFYRAAASRAEPAPAAPRRRGSAPAIVLDVRGLEPPAADGAGARGDATGSAPAPSWRCTTTAGRCSSTPSSTSAASLHETDEPEPGLVRILIRTGEA